MNDSRKSQINNLAVCKKDLNGKVLSQNENCQKICGSREGRICIDNCMEKYKAANPDNSIGTFQFGGLSVDDEFFDVLMVNDGDQILTLLLDMSQSYSDQRKFFKRYNLTARENEIVDLVLKHMTNKGIADVLCISETTLKTHINNILKKIPKEHWPRSRKNERYHRERSL